MVCCCSFSVSTAADVSPVFNYCGPTLSHRCNASGYAADGRFVVRDLRPFSRREIRALYPLIFADLPPVATDRRRRGRSGSSPPPAGRPGGFRDDLLSPCFHTPKDIRMPSARADEWFSARAGIKVGALAMKRGDLQCLPHAYVLGMPKCATTDIWARVNEHPQAVPTLKEPVMILQRTFVD